MCLNNDNLYDWTIKIIRCVLICRLIIHNICAVISCTCIIHVCSKCCLKLAHLHKTASCELMSPVFGIKKEPFCIITFPSMCSSRKYPYILTPRKVFCFAPPALPVGNSSLASYFASKILTFKTPSP